MSKFEIRNTSDIGEVQFKKIIERSVISRQTSSTIGESKERRTRKGFLESRVRIELLEEVDEERFSEWVAESLRGYRGSVSLVLHIKQIDDDEELDIPELEDSEPEPFDIYELGLP